MGLKARVLTLLHLVFTFCAVALVLIGFVSNNWIESLFTRLGTDLFFTSGLFTGCITLSNLTTICSARITYASRATYNLELSQDPSEYVSNLYEIAKSATMRQQIDPNIFTLDASYFNEGAITFSDSYRFFNSFDSTAIIVARILIPLGLSMIIFSATFNFFLSCVYSAQTVKYFIGIYIFGSILVTWASSIIYLSYSIDLYTSHPDLTSSPGLGMILTICGVVILIGLCILLSVTLLTMKKAKIKNIQKTATLVNKATMMTLGQNAANVAAAQQAMMTLAASQYGGGGQGMMNGMPNMNQGTMAPLQTMSGGNMGGYMQR